MRTGYPATIREFARLAFACLSSRTAPASAMKATLAMSCSKIFCRVCWLQIAVISVIVITRAAAPCRAATAVDKHAWLDAAKPVDQRVDALLSAMTLGEKVGQMWQTNGIGGEPTGDVKNLVG